MKNRVQEALASQGLACRVRVLPDSARTSAEAARAIGCTVGQIAKSLVFKRARSGEPVLVIASGSNRVDTGKLERLVGEAMEKANADFVRARTGFAIGGVPPVAHETPLETWLDESLFGFETVWAAAGTPHSVFEIAPDDLLRITAGKRADLAERAPAGGG